MDVSKIPYAVQPGVQRREVEDQPTPIVKSTIRPSSVEEKEDQIQPSALYFNRIQDSRQ